MELFMILVLLETSSYRLRNVSTIRIYCRDEAPSSIAWYLISLNRRRGFDLSFLPEIENSYPFKILNGIEGRNLS